MKPISAGEAPNNDAAQATAAANLKKQPTEAQAVKAANGSRVSANTNTNTNTNVMAKEFIPNVSVKEFVPNPAARCFNSSVLCMGMPREEPGSSMVYGQRGPYPMPDSYPDGVPSQKMDPNGQQPRHGRNNNQQQRGAGAGKGGKKMRQGAHQGQGQVSFSYATLKKYSHFSSNCEHHGICMCL